jgi:uncharacterized membrane protein
MEPVAQEEIPGKSIGIIAYITFIGLIIAIVMNMEKKSEFAKYHIRQMLGLVIAGIASSIVGIIPFIGWLISLVAVFLLLFMWIMGLINAVNGKMIPVPVLGEKFAIWFKDF